MVMKQNAMRKNLRQSIVKSLGRYIAIVMIIALGAALFVGLLMTKADMVATGQYFMDRQNMFDLRIMNSYGWTQEHLDAVRQMEGLEDIEALYYQDLIASIDEGDNAVYRFISIPERINQVALRGGRMPQNPNECLADGYFFDSDIIGSEVVIRPENEEDALEAMHELRFTVVGFVATPLYMDMNRGTTSVGSGSIEQYFYIPSEAMTLEYIPEICVTLPGDYAIYTERYTDAMEEAADILEPQLQLLADDRFQQVLQDAQEAYQDGLAEYRDGLVEYAEAKAEAERELADAYQQLLDGEQEIIDNEKRLQDGEQQIAQAKLTLLQGQQSLLQGKQELASAKAEAYQQISATKMEMMEQAQALMEEIQGLETLLQGYDIDWTNLNTQILPLETSLAFVSTNIQTLDAMIEATDKTIDLLENGFGEIDSDVDFIPSVSDSDLQALRDIRDGYVQEREELVGQREDIQSQLDELYAQQSELNSLKSEQENKLNSIKNSLAAVTEGLVTVAAAEMIMNDQFEAAEAQIEMGEAQLEAGKVQIQIQEQNIADGWVALEEGKQELADGWLEYEDGKLEAEQELADALIEIQDAAVELADGWETIQKMTDNEVIILNRNSNVGYNNLESSSDIVQGVSRVLPVFFLLVASLVCITTMTRMIDEERTQIGTLKALGYSNSAIIGKYLFYSGSGAVLGCGIGVTLGSTIFPSILWQAYQIMLYIQPRLVLTVNIGLCFAVVAVYTGVLMLVTWYCCRRALQEEPAELIRPKAPDPGKKIFMEYLPVWKHISFLNKVMVRNIFRYRQRLAMMLVGIGGCTALLVTGFGLRDSIVNVVDFQFEDITLYDLEVYFREEITEESKTAFMDALLPGTETMFYHQSSVDLDYEGRIKEIHMISAGEPLSAYIDLHSGDEKIPLPGMNEVILTVGSAEMLGIQLGDTVKLRNSDFQTLTLTVSGINDNHVNNYAIVAPETIEAQWGELPSVQMAYVKVPDDQDVHLQGAEISELMEVMNVSVSADLANMVGNMMEALDLVIVVIVVCAGLLAATVLYNLTNININERIREIATIKVLGFRSGETGAYVFKENLTLTVAGAFLGIFLGKLMLMFVMTQIKIDMVWFRTVILPPSYIISVVLTIVSALIVDYVFYFKLQTINMAEALKSVE